MKLSILPWIAIALLSGCATAPPTVVDNRAEAIKSIRAAEEAAIQAFGKRDGELSASMYAPDAALMMTNMGLVTGAAVKPVIKEMMADPNFSMAFNTVKVEAATSGELGYTRGTYTLTMTDPVSKKAVRESGKYVTVYARQSDGSWKMVDDISNPDAPAVPVVTKK